MYEGDSCARIELRHLLTATSVYMYYMLMCLRAGAGAALAAAEGLKLLVYEALSY